MVRVFRDNEVMVLISVHLEQLLKLRMSLTSCTLIVAFESMTQEEVFIIESELQPNSILSGESLHPSLPSNGGVLVLLLLLDHISIDEVGHLVIGSLPSRDLSHEFN